MTNQIVTENAITEQAVDHLRATWETACDAQRAAHAAYVAKPSMTNLNAVKATMAAERIANLAWKAGERALQDMWLAERAADEEARLQAMCAAYDLLEEGYDGFDDHAYQLTPAGEFYLDHHYQNDSEAPILALDGESPYGDGTTGWVQPTPAHPCYTNGVADMDALSRYEDLSY